MHSGKWPLNVCACVCSATNLVTGNREQKISHWIIPYPRLRQLMRLDQLSKYYKHLAFAVKMRHLRDRRLIFIKFDTETLYRPSKIRI